MRGPNAKRKSDSHAFDKIHSLLNRFIMNRFSGYTKSF